jgi:hypothetical protein
MKEKKRRHMSLDLNDILIARKMPVEEERHLNMTIKVLKEQIEVFHSRLEPHDTGHLHTTISTLNHRITELKNEKEESGQTRSSGMA